MSASSVSGYSTVMAWASRSKTTTFERDMTTARLPSSVNRMFLGMNPTDMDVVSPDSRSSSTTSLRSTMGPLTVLFPASSM